EDLNLKFLRILPSEWNTHVVVWRNKLDLDTMSIDDIYNNFKIVEQEKNGKKITINGSDTSCFDKSKVECYNCHKMGHFVREYRGPRNQDSRNMYQDSSRRTMHEEEIPPKAMVAINGVGFDWSYMAKDEVPTNMALIAFQTLSYNAILPPATLVYNTKRCAPPKTDLSYSGLKEYKQPEFESYRPKTCEIESKNASEDIPNELKEHHDAPLVKDRVSDNKDCSVEPISNAFKRGHSQVIRPYNKYSTYKKTIFNKMVNTVRVKDTTARKRAVEAWAHWFQVTQKTLHFHAVKRIFRYLKGQPKLGLWYPRDSPFDLEAYSDSDYAGPSLDRKSTTGSCQFLGKRALVIKPHNKTPYELIRGRLPLIDFMKPFGCPFTILNTRDSLGKFDEKEDEGFFVKYSVDDQVTRSEFEGLLQQERQTEHINSTNSFNTVVSPVNTAGPSFANTALPSNINVAGTPFTKAFEEHLFKQFSPFKIAFSPLYVPILTPINDTIIFGNAYVDEAVEEEVDMNNVVSSIQFLMLLSPNFLKIILKIKIKEDERGMVVKNKARLVAQGHTQEEGTDYDEIEEAVYVCQPLDFEDPHFLDKVYKVEKALYGLHQAPKAWYETLSPYLMDNGFHKGQIVKTLFIQRHKDDILLVQVYVDDVIFGSTKKELSTKFKKLMHDKFHMSSMGELYFWDFKFNRRTVSTPIEPNKGLVKDAEAEDVDVHLYRSMIRSLMYLTTSRLDITFAVYACARFQVTPKTSHLHTVKRIFRYLKGIKREFSAARTPQQHGVTKRKNKTLVDDARTMALVIKPHNKTPYELIHGRPPLIDFMKPFGCPVTILNTKDSLGKFDEKADEGFFVKYFMVSKDMRVFNKRTRIVVTEKQTNGIARTKDIIVAGPKDSVVDAGKKATEVDESRVSDNGGRMIKSQETSGQSLLNRFFRNKEDERGMMVKNKARLVAQGHTQEEVQQKSDGIFISQEKYVAAILKKFDFTTVKTVSTPIEPNKALVKDAEAKDVDLHLYRSMIGSLMYLTTSKPDITFVVCAYVRDSPFDLEAYSDSDYARASLDRKSKTESCQFLGKRLISWQCKKQTIVANSTTEAQYVAAASCYGHVLWIQNQMLDYGFNLMNTKIYIDNESTICIVKNIVFYSKTKHIKIRHHFIRDSYEKKLIQVIKIHTDHNVTDLLTKAFDVGRFNFLVASIGLLISEDVFDMIWRCPNDMSHHNEIFVNLSLIKKVSSDTKRVGTGYSGVITPLFEIMMVQAPEVVGDIPTDTQDIPILTQPSSSQPRGNTNQEGNRGRQLRFLTPSHKLRKEYLHLPMIHYPMGRIAEIDVNEDLFLIDETAQDQGWIKDQVLFGVHNLDGDKVFVDVITGEDVEKDAIVAESVKGLELEQESAKKQMLVKQEQAKVAEDDTAELKRCLEIVPKDDDDVAIEATPLSSKSPTIVDYKIYKERKKSYFKIIRADGNSQNYLTFRTMFKNFNREDLEVLRSIFKRFKKTKPMDDMDNLSF
nr:putative ribonuclease H-like domain-containing protein [Tanacetum cinerariifolium]